MKYSFQHFVDIATSAESMQIINFNVGGKDVLARCAHLFNAYKYFKLGKMSVKFVPASTLPVDPLGMSYGDTDPLTVDPRDQLNPGLVRITNGEDIVEDISNVPASQQEKMYQAMMLDPRWYKFSLQSGFKRSAVPLYWQIGQLHQDQWPGANVNYPVTGGEHNYASTHTGSFQFVSSAGSTAVATNTVSARIDGDYSSPLGLQQVGHRGRLGYLPTDAYEQVWSITSGASGKKAMIHNIPQIRTITCVLPKAYKTIYYYRVYITETVFFSGLRSIAPSTWTGQEFYVAQGIDQFIVPPDIYASPPDRQISVSRSVIPNYPTNNGDGEDGSY